MGKLELSILAGAESKAWLQDLTNQIDRLEKLLLKLDQVGGAATEVKAPATAKKALKATPIAEPEAEDDEEELVPKAKKGSKAAAVDFDEEEVDDGDSDFEEDDGASDEADELEAAAAVEDDEEDLTPPPPPVKVKKPPGRPKKYTREDVNAACMAFAKANGKDGRNKVLAILKKRYKTEKVGDIPPELYGDCIEAMQVTQ